MARINFLQMMKFVFAAIALIVFFSITCNLIYLHQHSVRIIERANKGPFLTLPKDIELNTTQTERMAVIHDHTFKSSYEYIHFPYTLSEVSISQNISESWGWLRWIVKNYDNLPNHTVFLHGHSGSWHTSPDFIEQLNEAKPDRVQMLGIYIWTMDAYYGQSELVGLNQVHQILFSRNFLEVANATRLWTKQCCAEMVVSREAIRQHPRSVYRAFVDLIAADPIQPWGWIFERSWENMFSQPFG